MQTTTTTPPEGGSSAMRWLEPQSNSNLYYTAWFYFPRNYSVKNYWQIMTWQSKDPATGQTHPFFNLNVGNRSNGGMYLYLSDWQHNVKHDQFVKDIPVGQWFRIDAHYVSAGDKTGEISVSQDGSVLFDLNGVQTHYANSDYAWSIANYSDSIVPSPSKIYVDDVSIHTSGSTPAPTPAPSPVTITTTGLPSGTIGASYSANLAASGGTAPYVWSVSGGSSSLPPGLSLSAQGNITGTPSSAGTYSFSAQVADSSATPQTTSASFIINVSSAPVPASGTMMWTGNTESGDLRDWYYPCTSASACGNEGGGEFDSGSAYSQASTDVAHSGSWSAKLIATTPPESGTRLFRWQESHANRALYYSTWVYLPSGLKITGNYFNLFQFKSASADGSRVDPIWGFYVNNGPNGTLYISAGWGAGGTQLAGPTSSDNVSLKSYTQQIAAVPTGRWVHYEAYMKESNAFDGQVTFWQDGTKLFDFQNVRTSYVNCKNNSWCADNGWSVNLYSDGLSPSPANIYVDDSAISTGYIQ